MHHKQHRRSNPSALLHGNILSSLSCLPFSFLASRLRQSILIRLCIFGHFLFGIICLRIMAGGMNDLSPFRMEKSFVLRAAFFSLLSQGASFSCGASPLGFPRREGSITSSPLSFKRRPSAGSASRSGKSLIAFFVFRVLRTK